MNKFKALVAAISMPAMGFVGLAATTQSAHAVIYCSYIGYPGGCIARPGVVLVARPYGVGHVGAVGVGHVGYRGAVGVGHVGNYYPGNRNGGVNRVGRRR